MAIIDYGAIAFKNKKCIQTDEWTSPLETVGYTTDEMEGNYFSVIGDRDISVGFCKNYMSVFFSEDKIDSFWCNSSDDEKDINCIKSNHGKIFYYNDKKIAKGKFTNANRISIMDWEVKQEKDYTYTFKAHYKGNDYEVHFGCGIDLPYYLKTGKYNLYKSFKIVWKDRLYNFREFLIDLPFYIRNDGIINGVRNAKRFNF